MKNSKTRTFTPNRIISLVPSLTELVYGLGMGWNLVGRTRFCIHPREHVERVPIIGGTKNPDIDRIRQLSPDYILANKEENRKEDVEQLRPFCKVRLTEIDTIEEALEAIRIIGQDIGADEAAKTICSEIRRVMESIPKIPPKTCAYFIWKKPWMVAGGKTYIHDVLQTWQLQNVFETQKRYPQVQIEELKILKPEYIFLSSEPYPFKQKDIEELKSDLPESKIILVNGEWFSWYGSGMPKHFRQLNKWRAKLA